MIKNEFKKVVLFFMSMMGLMSIFQSAYSQTVQTFSATGLQNWTCPAGITSVTVECWGAGGGSGGVANVLNAASGGGGGGAYAKSVVSVTPGNTYTIYVGVGGAGGSNSGTSGANGGASSFNTNIVFAEGGFGGGGSLSSTSLGAGGNGGGAATSIGSVKFGGGMGAAGILNLSGGGGGSSAGNSTVGNNASTSNGGAAPIGGVAGASASTVTTGAGGVNGLAGGSGSAGARRGSTAVGYAGGFGGNGKVVLSYVCTPPTVTSTQTNVLCNGNNTGAVNITVSGGAPFTGAPTINQQQTSAGCGTNFNDFWQSFTPSTSGLFHSIDVSLLMNSPTVGNWYVYSGSGTGGALLASGSYNFSALGGAQWQNILITGSPFLISGQQYTFRMSNADWNQACGGNVYAGGTDNFGTDRGFRTYMTPAPYNYSWSNGAVTEDINNLTAGSYTVTVTDANSCITTSTVLISQPSPLTATTVVNNVLCNGGATGAINLTVSGGAIPYNFNWGGGITTEDRTGLPAGVYTCTITDANGCLTTKTSTVTQPPILSSSNVVTNVSCNGASTGAINLTPVGGTIPYTFNWGGGVTTEDRVSIPAGAYSCTITDVNSCTVTASAIVNQPAALLLSRTITNVLCFGSSTGAINLTATGGTAPYTFNWGGGITTEDRASLIAGVYTCTVTDINGCIATISSTVTQPATALAANTTVTNVLCFGAATGAINLTPTGGTPSYSFNWGGGIITEDRTGLPTGVYTCTVTDANACLTTVTSTITQPATALTATTTVTNVSCFGGSNGTINLTPSGGTAPYTFNWGGGIITEDRTGLPAGVYTCTVTDSNGCLATVSSTITQPATALIANTTVTNVLCFGSATGAINLTATGGTTPYTFNWGGGITTEDRSGLPAGVYSCTVTDVNTCTTSIAATVTEPSVLIANAVVSSSINCNGGSGVVTVNASGGTPTYSGTGTFTVVAGTYTYTVTDANGCMKTTTVNVTQPAPLTITVSSSSSSICVGATASLTATGASTYTWNPGSLTGNTVTVSPISTTIYTATGTTSLGCVDSKTISLTVNANPTVTAVASSSAICSGATATLTGSGALTYTWNPGALSGSVAVVSPSATTNYTLIGTNASGCTNTKTISVTVNSNPTVSIVASPTAICVGSTASLTASGASSYLWNTGGTTALITVAPSVSTVYSVTGTNAAGCSKTQTVNVVVNSLPTLSISATSTSICNGSSVTLTGSGASTYTWNPGTLTSSVVVVSPSSSTVYTLTGVNVNGCANTETINITVNSNPTVTATASSSAICAGETATLTAGGATTYSWSSGSISSLETVTPSSSSVYTVIGTDAIGCANSTTLSLTVNSLPVITINSSAAAICSGSSATLTATGANSYVWNTTETTAIIEVAPSVSTGYTVTGTAATGCINTQTIGLTVNPLPTLSLTASPSSICVGATSTLTASGANTYSWSTGSTLATIFESPSTTTIYTVIGTDAVGCVNTETVNLTVNTLPTLTISTSSNSVCVGNTATLTAIGATTYSWSSGSTTSSEVVSPTATTLYTVFAMDAVGCMNSDTVRIYANALPNISTNVNTNTVCLGGVVVFSNLGANTFTLTPSALTGSLVNVPMNTVGVTVYTVTGTASSGCTNTNTVSITTYALPSVSISPSSSTICAGQSVVLNATGANTYTWSGSGSVSNSITDFPSANTIYSVTGTDMNGCSNSASASVNISNTPTISVNTPSTNVCMGYTMTISASGASNYVWSTGATTNSINVQPFFNTTYSVVGSNGGTCTDTVIIALTVLPLPSVSASASNTLVCSGQMVNLSATGTATAYAWNPGTLIGAGQTVQITAPITYTAYGQGANGCAFFSTVFIDIQSGSAVTPITTPSVICVGDSAILSVMGGSVPTWSSNVVPNVNVVTPLTSTTYTYGALDINGCSSVITFTVGIDENCNVIIYNGFTPNGDGINDFWIIDNIDKYTNNKVFIYNRWGNEIFSTSNYDNTTNVWDGKANGQVITSGTYFFVIVDGSEKLIKKGWIEITN
ncbi:MAG: hypothetical protein C0448_11460 [Sphingobacteriaceae bacterium]|nr:hypothetical protein [Sphingobacteriaceae bacterium]